MLCECTVTKAIRMRATEATRFRLNITVLLLWYSPKSTRYPKTSKSLPRLTRQTCNILLKRTHTPNS